MNRAMIVTLASLVAVLGSFLGPQSPSANASGLRYKAVPLESLPIVDSGNNVTVLTSGQTTGLYRGTKLTHGLQINADGDAEYNLGGHYDELTGTVYRDDTSSGCCTPQLTIYDSSDPAHKKTLFNASLQPEAQASFHINLRGVMYLDLVVNLSFNCCVGKVDITGTFTKGTRPPTQVIPRYPTNGAGVSASSKVLFGWQPFPHATSYAFHIWLVGLSGSASLTSTTPFSFSASIYHKTSYTWDDHGFLPGTYQYSLLPLDDQGHNLAGWSTPTQITIAS